MSHHFPRLLVANWKSHKTLEEAKHWAEELRQFMQSNTNKFGQAGQPHIVVTPPYPFLIPLAETLQNVPGVTLGVQDISPFPAGKYTGAVSVRNLEGLDITHAIVGHSERRRYFHESDIEVANKVDLLVEAGITPILCVDKPCIQSQADVLDKKLKKKCVIAYEPLESIGTGVSEEVAKVLPVITQITEAFGQVPTIYGGSVDEENINAYLLAMDGVLVGGASLEIQSFSDICLASASH